MNGRQRLFMILLMSICSEVAAGVYCTKLEYAELKEMPVDKLKEEYCKDAAATLKRQTAVSDFIKSGSMNLELMEHLADQAHECIEARDAAARVLSNVHHMEKPACDE